MYDGSRIFHPVEIQNFSNNILHFTKQNPQNINFAHLFGLRLNQIEQPKNFGERKVTITALL